MSRRIARCRSVKTESSFKVVEGRLTEDRLIIQIYVY